MSFLYVLHHSTLNSPIRTTLKMFVFFSLAFFYTSPVVGLWMHVLSFLHALNHASQYEAQTGTLAISAAPVSSDTTLKYFIIGSQT